MNMRSALRAAQDDIVETYFMRYIPLIFGWQDVAQRYRRSRVGAFWLTINMGVMIGALGAIFGTLFQLDIMTFLPFVASGLIFWTFISTMIAEGCVAFSSSEGIILQVRLPLFVHIVRVWWRNCIILAHNLVIYPILLIGLWAAPSWNLLWAFPGFALLSANLLWMALMLATLCARFRDMPQVVANVLQIAFYATPIMWTPQNLSDGVVQQILLINPFFHLLSLVRLPLLGDAPAPDQWLIGLLLCVAGWTVTLLFFGRYRWRVPYWL